MLIFIVLGVFGVGVDIDNFINKFINIHTLTEEVSIDISSLMDLIDHILVH
jgi:hypothetical protein